MGRFTHPEGSRLPALERNILKYRAMEMVLVLFYAEELQNFVITSIRESDKMRGASRENGKTPAKRIPEGAKKPFQMGLKSFVADGILKESEKDEIERLIDYRNHIAHIIYELTGDIGRTNLTRDFVRFRRKGGGQYDYNALTRLRFYRRELVARRARSHVVLVSLSPLFFEPAQHTFEQELKRLRRTIDGQLAKRKQKNAKLQGELSLDGTDLTGDFQPYHPANQYKSGRLTKRGVEICFRLYDLGKSPLAVAHLMQMSYKAATKRKELWRAAGGQGREKMNLEIFDT